jgi:hypothetical protein
MQQSFVSGFGDSFKNENRKVQGEDDDNEIFKHKERA